jgi:alpha-glucosidase
LAKSDRALFKKMILTLFIMYLRIILFSFLLLLPGYLFAQEEVGLRSPDGHIVFTLRLTESGPAYSVAFKKNNLLENSSLHLEAEGGDMLQKAVISRPPVFKEVNENYKLIVGKASVVNNHYRQVIISLKNGLNQEYVVDLEVRAFNDGIAFRYLFPKQKGLSSLTLLEERTQFRFTADPIIKALLLPNFTTSHEGLYTTMPLSGIKDDTLMDMPALFQFPGKIFMAITEAALLDYAGMYLIKKQGILCSQLSPLPGQSAIKVKADLPHTSPWRVLLIGDRPGTLIESNIITSLNKPSAIKDVSWLKPGTSTFPWWNGTIIPDTGVKGGNNFETNKYYIDFCAANNITYHTIVEYGGHEWYTNDGEGYQPGNNVDITKPVAGLDMKQVCDYAKGKNVGVRVWTHWKALYPKLDTAFAIFEKWGLSGMMVDFMDRDDQEMVNIQTEILQKAAAHRLHIQFHGAYKPTGLSRTYPNEFTREGTLNYEVDKWDTLVSPEADLNIAFTRLLAGPTDYHLGGFRALPQSKFVVQNFRPYVMGTRCHMLAMYVVLESYLSMVCDYPDAYIGEPGFEVIKNMPATWDETRVPAAEVDQFVSIARRKKDSWYIGTITNNIAREITINLRFLPVGKYTAEIYGDAADADENANHLTKKTIVVDRNTVLKLVLAPGGGNIIVLNKLKK